MMRAQVLAPVGRAGGLPLSRRVTRESPNMTPDGRTATRIIELLAKHRDDPFCIAARFHAVDFLEYPRPVRLGGPKPSIHRCFLKGLDLMC